MLRTATRGLAGKTSIDYYKDNKIKYITRGSITSDTHYDDKGRLRSIGFGNAEIILGYWRDNKLIKITGRTYGKGMEVSYGPDYPPFNAKIISSDDNSEFTSTDTESLYKIVDLYLYCQYIRRLPVLFDGNSFTFFANYFGNNVQEYFIMNELCEIYT